MIASIPLPQDRFGMSQERFNLPAIPADLPERGVMQAANNLNDYRYYNLTAKQRLFVEEYFRNGLDEAAAALATGWAADIEEARRVGRKLIRKDYIAKAIDLAFAYYSEATKVNLPAVIREINLVAFSNAGDYWTNDGTGDPQLSMPADNERDKLAAIQEITVDTYNEGRGENAKEVKRIKFKLYNKLDALEKLLKIANVKGVATPDPVAPNVHVDAKSTTNVSVINLVPVPTGSFVPAPERPELVAPSAPLIDMRVEQPVPV